MTLTEPRPTCWTCRKPADHCLCDDIPTVHNRTGIIVLQHRKERDHPLGTARFIKLGLANQRVHVLIGHDGASPEVPLPAGAALLYPGPDAVDLDALTPEARPTDLVILDATWPLAHQLYRDNPWIRALPHVAFTPGSPSRYRIRPEPRPEYVSTLEAAIEALRRLEPELDGLEGLLRAFDRMIDRQVDAGEHRSRPRPRRERHRPPRAFPAVLDSPDADVVIAYIEQGPRPSAPPSPPLHWTAVRWSDGAVFDEVSTTHAPLGDDFVAGLGLDRNALQAGRPPEDVAADFRQFCGGARALWCWNRTTLGFLNALELEGAPLRLKPIWTNHLGTRFVSHLREIVADLDLGPIAPLARGRAGRRLACTAAMARHLQELRRASVV